MAWKKLPGETTCQAPSAIWDTPIPVRMARQLDSDMVLEAGQRLAGGALAGSHGAVHVAHPEGGGLGARPVDASHRCPQGAPVVGEETGGEQPHRAAPAPLLGRPVLGDEVPGLERLWAE